jgi:hypothetical protein
MAKPFSHALTLPVSPVRVVAVCGIPATKTYSTAALSACPGPVVLPAARPGHSLSNVAARVSSGRRSQTRHGMPSLPAGSSSVLARWTRCESLITASRRSGGRPVAPFLDHDWRKGMRALSKVVA